MTTSVSHRRQTWKTTLPDNGQPEVNSRDQFEGADSLSTSRQRWVTISTIKVAGSADKNAEDNACRGFVQTVSHTVEIAIDRPE